MGIKIIIQKITARGQIPRVQEDWISEGSRYSSNQHLRSQPPCPVPGTMAGTQQEAGLHPLELTDC